VSLGGSGFAAAAAMLLTAIVGNQFGTAGTGVFFQAMGIFVVVTQLMRLGTNSGIVRYIAEERAFGRVGGEWRIVVVALVPVLIVSTIVGIGLWTWSEPLAQQLTTDDPQSLAALLRAMPPFVV